MDSLIYEGEMKFHSRRQAWADTMARDGAEWGWPVDSTPQERAEARREYMNMVPAVSLAKARAGVGRWK
jgi:hypothetical protein